MDRCNIVFIAKSLDGYISDKNGGLDWLQSVPNPGNVDMGYAEFIGSIDAVVMGRNTFETVCNFDMDWPYTIPVFVLSRKLKTIREEFKYKAELIRGPLENVMNELNQRGYNRLYIDGGATIQGFLKEDLVDELIITTIPVLLGGGTRLFTDLPKEFKFQHIRTEVFLNEIVQSHYRRKR
jgi:dihydrofolate reductase